MVRYLYRDRRRVGVVWPAKKFSTQEKLVFGAGMVSLVCMVAVIIYEMTKQQAKAYK